MGEQVFTIELCIDTAKVYGSMTCWMNEQRKQYKWAYSNGLLRKIIDSMNWNVRGDAAKISNIIGSAKRYQHKSDWQRGEGSSYALAKYYGVFELATQHMSPKLSGKRAAKRSLTKGMCIDIASGCNSRTAFKTRDPSAYNKARKDGFLHECCNHM